MRMRHCPNCNRQMGHARQLGVGTLLACAMTGGLWIFTIPFHSPRCLACGNPTPITAEEGWRSVKKCVIGYLCFLAFCYGVPALAKLIALIRPTEQQAQETHILICPDWATPAQCKRWNMVRKDKDNVRDNDAAVKEQEEAEAEAVREKVAAFNHHLNNTHREDHRRDRSDW